MIPGTIPADPDETALFERSMAHGAALSLRPPAHGFGDRHRRCHHGDYCPDGNDCIWWTLTREQQDRI